MEGEIIGNGMWRMRCKVPWHVMVNMERNDALARDDRRWSEVKHAQVLGKELATSSKQRKTRKQTQKKHIPLNMSTSKISQFANSNLEFGKKLKV